MEEAGYKSLFPRMHTPVPIPRQGATAKLVNLQCREFSEDHNLLSAILGSIF